MATYNLSPKNVKASLGSSGNEHQLISISEKVQHLVSDLMI
jgi:hypothetical protein